MYTMLWLKMPFLDINTQIDLLFGFPNFWRLALLTRNYFPKWPSKTSNWYEREAFDLFANFSHFIKPYFLITLGTLIFGSILTGS
jgi:hypothetical protein